MQTLNYEEVEARLEPPINTSRSLLDYLGALKRRAWIIVLASAIGLGTAWWHESKQLPKYTAEALLQRKEQQSPLQTMQTETRGTPNSAIASQLEILRSRSVLGPVVEQRHMHVTLEGSARSAVTIEQAVHDAVPGLYALSKKGNEVELRADRSGSIIGKAAAGGRIRVRGLTVLVNDAARLTEGAKIRVSAFEEAVIALERSIKAEQIPNTSLIRIAYTSTNPELAAGIVNAAARSYEIQAARSARESAARRRDFLALQLAQAGDSVRSAQQSLALYQESARILDPRSEGEILSNQTGVAEGELRDLSFQEGVLESLRVSLRSSNPNNDAFRRLLSLSGSYLPAGQDLYRRLQELESERSRMTSSSSGLTQGNSRVQVVDSLIGSVKEEIRQVTDQTVALLKSRRVAAERRVADLRKQAGDLPGRASVYSQLTERADAQQKTFQLLAGRYFEAQVAEATAAGDVEIVDAAAVPVRADPSDRARTLVLGLMLGLLFGTVMALIIDHLDGRLRNVEDAKNVAGLEVLAVIPVFAKRKGTGIVGRFAETGAEEAYRALKTMLRFSNAKRPRIIAITSQGPAEGKSATSANLALTLTADGSKVLLLDADMRRPRQHETFSVPRIPGLADVIQGTTPASEAIHAVADTSMSIMPSGTNVREPGELLGSARFRALLSAARKEYDYIILDTPPVLAVADVLNVSDCVDGVIIVIRASATTRHALADAVGALRQVKAPIIGAVFNAVQIGGRRARRYYGYASRYGDYAHSTNGKDVEKQELGRAAPSRV